MACTASKTPLLRTVASRGYAAQASHKVAAKSGEIQTTTLPNKLIVASTESSSPVSRISIVYRAGARNEKYDNLGASHMLRIAAGLSTKHATGFGITRSIQQIGGTLSVVGDRETISYTVEVTRDNIETGLKFLEATATGQIFKPWEISDSMPRLQVDLARISDGARAVDMLNKAAYRTGLGNSLFCPKHHIGKISPEALQHYCAENCTTNRTAVVGVGIDHNLLSGYAQSLQIESGAGHENKSKYHGGELRADRAGGRATVAIAAEGGAWENPQEALAFLVLAGAAGRGPATKRGGNNGALTKAVDSSGNIAVSSLCSIYTDSGLFGFVASGCGKEIGKAIESGVKALKSGSISDEDVARGKEVIKSEIALCGDSEAGLCEQLGQAAALTGSARSVQATLAAIDGVQASDVKAAARKVASGKLSIASVGYLANVPYRDQL
uniref:Putative microtubule associated complex n=1 Tax=Corethrella appendiculata TaxID=1370023 RepID=U5EUK4_9DIPT